MSHFQTGFCKSSVVTLLNQRWWTSGLHSRPTCTVTNFLNLRKFQSLRRLCGHPWGFLKFPEVLQVSSEEPLGRGGVMCPWGGSLPWCRHTGTGGGPVWSDPSLYTPQPGWSRSCRRSSQPGSAGWCRWGSSPTRSENTSSDEETKVRGQTDAAFKSSNGTKNTQCPKTGYLTVPITTNDQNC